MINSLGAISWSVYVCVSVEMKGNYVVATILFTLVLTGGRLQYGVEYSCTRVHMPQLLLIFMHVESRLQKESIVCTLHCHCHGQPAIYVRPVILPARRVGLNVFIRVVFSKYYTRGKPLLKIFECVFLNSWAKLFNTYKLKLIQTYIYCIYFWLKPRRLVALLDCCWSWIPNLKHVTDPCLFVLLLIELLYQNENLSVIIANHQL